MQAATEEQTQTRFTQGTHPLKPRAERLERETVPIAVRHTCVVMDFADVIQYLT